jgi:uncharacterized protein (TIGR02147 family)
MTNSLIHIDKDPIAFLRAEFVKRQKNNPRYSLRSYAKTLGVNAGRLSEYLALKRPLSYRTACKISDGLVLSSDARIKFVEAVLRRVPTKTKAAKQADPSYDFLALDQFEVIAHWQYFAVLNLINTAGFRNDESWIAKRLNVHPIVVRDVLLRLRRLNMVAEDKKHRLIRTNNNWYVGSKDISTALREFHAVSLKKDIESLELVDIKDRDISSIMFPANLKRIPEVKKLIKSFQRKISKLMDDGPSQSQEVYRLAVQQVPLSSKTGK